MNARKALRICLWVLSAFITTLSQVSASGVPAMLTAQAGHAQVQQVECSYARGAAIQRSLSARHPAAREAQLGILPSAHEFLVRPSSV